jgi:hypothetical protein
MHAYTAHATQQQPTNPLRIEVFIRHRIQQLGLTEEAFILKMEMRNFKRKQKKLRHLFQGNWQLAEQVIPFLAAALNVSTEMLDYVIEQTKADIASQNEALRRQHFRPAAFFLTKLSIPSSITMAGITGTTPHVDITNVNEQDYLDWVLQYIEKHPKKMELLGGFFGGVLGYCIAYTPDLMVQFDLQGNFIGTTGTVILPGRCVISIG